MFSVVCVNLSVHRGSWGGSPPYMALARDLLFTIKTGDSHKTPLMPDILQGLWWQEDSTTDLRLCHVYLLFILIYDMLIRVKNRLFDSFYNKNAFQWDAYCLLQ